MVLGALSVLLVLVRVSGCAGGGPRPPVVCEDYIASLECGDFDFSTIYPDDFCDTYGGEGCDFHSYFRCLADHAECEDGTFTYPPCPLPICT